MLQDLVDSYNNTYHRSIGRAPATVSLLNVGTVRRKLYGEMNSTAPKKFKFRVGDHVRLSLRKRLFKKWYKMNWTKEIFQITHQLSRTPVVFTSQDLLERPTEGTFYEEELQKVKSPDIFRIEKVLKKRTKDKKTLNILCVGLVTGLILIAGFSHQILNPSQRMNENSQRASFHLVLSSTSSHEIFLENHVGKFIVMLPKEIQLDQKFHWEMALVELFWPKQDSVAVIENLWYETQRPNRRWKRTYVSSSAFLSVTSLFDYLRKIFKDKIDITYDEYKQMVIWKMKEMNSNLFKVRLSNLLAKCMGFNLSLEFAPLDVPDDEYAKITKVWEKSARRDPNHPQHYIEIVFTPGQSLVNNEKPEDYSVPVFFHVQCSLAAATLVNGKFRNCLRTVEMNNERRV